MSSWACVSARRIPPWSHSVFLIHTEKIIVLIKKDMIPLDSVNGSAYVSTYRRGFFFRGQSSLTQCLKIVCLESNFYIPCWAAAENQVENVHTPALWSTHIICELTAASTELIIRKCWKTHSLGCLNCWLVWLRRRRRRRVVDAELRQHNDCN